MGFITPRMWDHPKFVSLPDPVTKLMWCWLLTTQQEIPGLILGGVGTIAEALRIAEPAARKSIGHLQLVEMAQIDAKNRIIRVPEAPEHNAPGNMNVLEGWWRRWQRQVPDSPLKYRHVESIKAVVDRLVREALVGKEPKKAERWEKSWADSFAKVQSMDQQPVQANLFDLAHLNSCETVPGTVPGTVPSRKQKAESRKQKAEAESRGEGTGEGSAAMPFTIAELLAALAERAKGRVTTSPFPRGLAAPITALIRECEAQGVGLEDARLVGEWIGAGALAFMSEGIGPNWVAKTGNLFDAVGKARGWRDQGRPVIGKQTNVVDIRVGRAEPRPAEAFGPAGRQELPPL